MDLLERLKSEQKRKKNKRKCVRKKGEREKSIQACKHVKKNIEKCMNIKSCDINIGIGGRDKERKIR